MSKKTKMPNLINTKDAKDAKDAKDTKYTKNKISCSENKYKCSKCYENEYNESSENECNESECDENEYHESSENECSENECDECNSLYFLREPLFFRPVVCQNVIMSPYGPLVTRNLLFF